MKDDVHLCMASATKLVHIIDNIKLLMIGLYIDRYPVSSLPGHDWKWRPYQEAKGYITYVIKKTIEDVLSCRLL